MPFGLDATGFSAKTLDDILASIRSKQKALFGEAFVADLDTSVVGQLNGIYAAELADLWDLAMAVWRSRYPSMALGASLDNVAEETGAIRLPDSRSTVNLTWSGTNGTIVPLGSIARVASTDARFRTTEQGTVASGTVTVPAEAIEFGPVLGPAGLISDIVTPISGITAVTNTLDAAIGSNVETDAAFRIRRNNLLRATGAGTIGAIRADLLVLDGVSEVRMFNNPTNVVDADGLPAHSFEAVVRGGTAQDIVDTIFASQPAGIQSFGTNSGTAVDSQGDSHTVQYSRPTDINMYVEVTLTRNSEVYGAGVQADGDALVKQAIVDYWLSFDERIAKDVITNAFYGVIYSVPGVETITILKVDDTTPATTTASTTIGPREIAVFDTSRITVTS